MQTSAVFRAILMLGFLVLLFGVDGSPAQENSKKKEFKDKSRKSSRTPRKMWLHVDPANVNSPESTVLSTNHYTSVSPWTYEDSYDESRIPSRISEAKCEKKGCITIDGNEDLGLESKPIYYQILVLRRVKNKNKYSLQLEHQTVSVGCTCVVPSVMSQ